MLSTDDKNKKKKIGDKKLIKKFNEASVIVSNGAENTPGAFSKALADKEKYGSKLSDKGYNLPGFKKGGSVSVKSKTKSNAAKNAATKIVATPKVKTKKVVSLVNNKKTVKPIMKVNKTVKPKSKK